ncbi:MAG: class I SAM-dependent methyltransferase [Deltaproteobacteria bacterium]|nr:class I SAM-dependent methyltransferase [Deltaproteobacteria bacterium]
MKIRESGMPEQDMWEKFFDPRSVLSTLGMTSRTGNVAEFGCGYGTFTFPAAQIIQGTIFAIDIEPDLISMVEDKARKQHLNNINPVLRDFMADGSGLPDESMDYVMLFNILHLDNPAVLLAEAWRILKKGGMVGIIHWNHDPSTPRGPSLAIRPKPEDCMRWAESAGFHNPSRYDLKPYHYGITFVK